MRLEPDLIDFVHDEVVGDKTLLPTTFVSDEV